MTKPLQKSTFFSFNTIKSEEGPKCHFNRLFCGSVFRHLNNKTSVLVVVFLVIILHGFGLLYIKLKPMALRQCDLDRDAWWQRFYFWNFCLLIQNSEKNFTSLQRTHETKEVS